MDSLHQALAQHFGHTSLKSGQQEIITRVLENTHTLAILPTGGGKSLCYQLPALVKEGLCLVISPLIALMRDQVEALVQKGIPAARIDSSTTLAEYENYTAQINSGLLKILYLSPERAAEPSMQKFLTLQHLSLIAVDEAHCISEWGHSFRPSYIHLAKVVKRLKPDVILALTATASAATAQSIRKAFGILKRDTVQTSFYRENLVFKVTVSKEADKKQALLSALQMARRTPAIVYATKRGDVEDIAAFLSSSGIPTRAYHAGMPASARGEVQDTFLAKKFPVICATIAFGMGVDMPDIRSVIHYHPPKSPEGWIQESGRAGRDGKPSHCELIINGDDRTILESLVMAKQPSKYAIEAILQNLFSQGNRAIISNYNLSTLNDIPSELLGVLLARLETDGWIKSIGASWMWCHVVPLRWDSSAKSRILQGFTKNEQVTLSELIDSKQRVSLLELSGHRINKLHQIITLLRELEASNDVRLKLSHKLTHYSISKQPDSISQLADQMKDVFEQHANNDLSRIDTVFKIAVSQKCIASALVKYFGEILPTPCGQCSACLEKTRARRLPTSKIPEITLTEMEQIQVLIKEKRPAIANPSRLARFLCGIYSPAMLRYRLYQHKSWGMLERLSYEDVLSTAKAML